MPHFKIVPGNSAHSVAAITAMNAGSVLNVVSSLSCGEADVFEDERYAFSVRLSGRGLWTIFRLENDPILATSGPGEIEGKIF